MYKRQGPTDNANLEPQSSAGMFFSSYGCDTKTTEFKTNNKLRVLSTVVDRNGNAMARTEQFGTMWQIKIAFQSKADHPRMCIELRSYDLDFDVMTLILNADLDVLKMYLYTKNEVSKPKLSKIRARIGQTQRRDRTH